MTRNFCFFIFLLNTLLFYGCSTLPGGKIELVMQSVSSKNKDKSSQPPGFNLVSEKDGPNGFEITFFNSTKNVEVAFTPFVSCESSLRVSNKGSALVKILWSDSYLRVPPGKLNTPIPAGQVYSSGAVAPQIAHPTLVPSGSEFQETLFSLNKISTATQYSSVYQGTHYVGEIAQGTYIRNLKTYPCSFEDYSERKTIESALANSGSRTAGSFKERESELDWQNRVREIATKTYGTNTIDFSLALDVGGTKFTIPFLFTVKDVKTKTNKEVEAEIKRKKNSK